MKFALTINGDSAVDSDKRMMREIMALLNSTSSVAVSTASIETDEDDDTGTPAVIQPGEVDAAGLPWDERIHSGGKTKTEKGVWRSKKGVRDEVVTAVTAELRAKGYVAQTAALASAPPVPSPTPVPVPVPEATPITASVPIPSPTPVPVPVAAPIVPVSIPTPVPAPVPVAEPAAPVVPAVPVDLDYAKLMGIISVSAQSGKLDGLYLGQVCAKFNLGDNLAVLAERPDLVPQIYLQLQVDGKL